VCAVGFEQDGFDQRTDGVQGAGAISSLSKARQRPLQRNLQEVASMLLDDGEPKLESEFVAVQIIQVAEWASCPRSNPARSLPYWKAWASPKFGRRLPQAVSLRA
jgi:hypothetical protein